MLAVYTFVFTVMFKARWASGSANTGEFALHIFSGLLIFGIFAETVSRAPLLIHENVTYVKKVVFPLEVLPGVVLGAALFNAAVGFVIFFIFYGLVIGPPPVTALVLPVLIAPLLFFTLGLSWLLASLGVFVRDVRYVVTVLISVMMFLSPIFYPASALPEKMRPYLLLNPIAPVLDSVKGALFNGILPDWILFGGALSLSLLVSWAGYSFFMLTRRAFSDVI